MKTNPLASLKIEIYADGADKAGILAQAAKPYVSGLTTNPSLMRKAGVTNYERFAREILDAVPEKPVSLEVLSDDQGEMIRQAIKISSWGANAWVKIPITNSTGIPSLPVIEELGKAGIKLNVTAVMTATQVFNLRWALTKDVPTIISIFSGRIADTGVDPMAVIRICADSLAPYRTTRLLWASTREVFNIRQAEQSGCDIITVPNDILAKAEKMLGYDLDQLSLDTVQMFDRDAKAAGFHL